VILSNANPARACTASARNGASATVRQVPGGRLRTLTRPGDRGPACAGGSAASPSRPAEPHRAKAQDGSAVYRADPAGAPSTGTARPGGSERKRVDRRRFDRLPGRPRACNPRTP
jgi:hypothetical protein